MATYRIELGFEIHDGCDGRNGRGEQIEEFRSKSTGDDLLRACAGQVIDSLASTSSARDDEAELKLYACGAVVTSAGCADCAVCGAADASRHSESAKIRMEPPAVRTYSTFPAEIQL